MSGRPRASSVEDPCRPMSAPTSHTPDLSAPIRVVIADAHPLYRDALAAVVANARDLRLTGTAADGREALDLIRRERPDVALLDVRMAVLSGPVVAWRVAEDGIPTRVLLLSAHEDVPAVGGCGFLGKDATVGDIHAAIRKVVADARAGSGPSRRRFA